MATNEPGAVVVVGSLHYDVVVAAPRLPRRGETVAGHGWRPKFGGKGGNQAVAAAMAGAPARMAGAVGDDGFGAFLLNGLDAAGVDRTHVAVLRGAASGMSVAVTGEHGDYAAVIVSGANLRIPRDFLAAEAFWRGARVLLLQNEAGAEVNAAAARRARAAGALVCLNAAPARPLEPDLVGLLDVLIVNALEAEALSGVAVADLDDALRAAAALRETVPAVVVTAGAAGVAAATAERRFSVPAVPVEVAGTHGAGDAFVGAFAAAVAGGTSFEEAVARANKAASAHVAAPLRPVDARPADPGPGA